MRRAPCNPASPVEALDHPSKPVLCKPLRYYPGESLDSLDNKHTIFGQVNVAAHGLSEEGPLTKGMSEDRNLTSMCLLASGSSTQDGHAATHCMLWNSGHAKLAHKCAACSRRCKNLCLQLHNHRSLRAWMSWKPLMRPTWMRLGGLTRTSGLWA